MPIASAFTSGMPSRCSQQMISPWTGRNCSATFAGGGNRNTAFRGGGPASSGSTPLRKLPRPNNLRNRFNRNPMYWIDQGEIMNLELHILQSFAPSNLNRDDTGSPKDCEFGGVRRARVSSQCWKRSIRLAFEKQGLLKEQSLAVRTRKIAASVAKLLVEGGKEVEAAKAVADNALAAVGLGAGKSGDSEYLLFVPKSALAQFAKTCLDHWETLQPRRSEERRAE